MNQAALILLALAASGLAQAQTAETIGDVDSYGHVPVILGAKQIPFTVLTSDCTLLPAGMLCAPLNASGTTNVEFKEVAVITVLPNATSSQLCLEFAPAINYNLNKGVSGTMKQSTARMYMRARYSNPLLANPGVVNAQGLPFPNGEIAETYDIFRKTVIVPFNEYFSANEDFTRRCGAQVLNKQRLIKLGLTPAQANLFFKQSTRIALDVVYETTYVKGTYANNYVTVYGDR